MTPKPAPWPVPRIGRALGYAALWALAWGAVMTALHAARIGLPWLVQGFGVVCLMYGLFIIFLQMKSPAGKPAAKGPDDPLA